LSKPLGRELWPEMARSSRVDSGKLTRKT
jgi:hypothetical protein